MIYQQTTQQAAPTMPVFSGRAEDFAQWELDLVDFAISFGHDDPQGQEMNGYLSSDEDYQAAPRDHGVAAPFVPRPHPGDRPVLGGDPLGPAIGTHNDQCKSHDNRDVAYKSEQKNKATFKLLLCQNVPSTCLTLIKDPITGYRNQTIRQIFFTFVDYL